MAADRYSQVHFFNTLGDIVASKPYAILHLEEVNKLIEKFYTLAKDVNAQSIEHASDFLRAVDNARNDGYFPVVILPTIKYVTALSLLR